MKGDIEKYWYCPGTLAGAICEIQNKKNCNDCPCRHRIWPTLEQYKQEYGKKYLDSWAIYTRNRGPNIFNHPDYLKWEVCSYLQLKNYLKVFNKKNIIDTFDIVCACTPWGCPPEDWRPA